MASSRAHKGVRRFHVATPRAQDFARGDTEAGEYARHPECHDSHQRGDWPFRSGLFRRAQDFASRAGSSSFLVAFRAGRLRRRTGAPEVRGIALGRSDGFLGRQCRSLRSVFGDRRGRSRQRAAASTNGPGGFGGGRNAALGRSGLPENHAGQGRRRPALYFGARVDAERKWLECHREDRGPFGAARLYLSRDCSRDSRKAQMVLANGCHWRSVVFSGVGRLKSEEFSCGYRPRTSPEP